MDTTCARCSSKKIIPDLPLVVNASTGGGAAVGTADVYVCRDPQAWIFKDATSGNLTVRVCADCGHAELHANNFRLLGEKYEQLSAQGSGN